MIGTCFPTGSGWAWEVLAIDGTIVASGHATTAANSSRASRRAWMDARQGRPDVDLARPGAVHFGGAHRADAGQSPQNDRRG